LSPAVFKIGEANEMTPADGGDDPPSNRDDRFAERLRGFGPLGILAILIILAGNFLFLPLSALLVLVWAWFSGTPWAELGFVRPKSWMRSVLNGIIFGAAFKLVMKALVMPLLGAPAINQAFHFLVGNRAALPGTLFLVIVGAGFGEETVFRGYLFERFRKLLGTSTWAKTLTVVVTSAVFGVIHYPLQGLAGAQQALLVGLVFGTIFAIYRQIFFLMIAHIAFDLMAVAIIYYDLEEEVAHFFFK
jgi:membrane protease YdiL (CAAX protease family)